ncbi:hypothetical protein J6590_027549 [Homalodisca vitripennis]|nr:hypothetical protein J6590_027549 [Homalodisca vitripennis]
MFPLQDEKTGGSGERTAVSRILGQVYCPDKDVPATGGRYMRKKRREVAVSGLQYLGYWDRFIVLTRMFPLQEEETGDSGERTAVSRILGQVYCPDKDVPATGGRYMRWKIYEVAVSGLQYLGYWDKFVVLTRMFPLQDEEMRGSGERTAVYCPDKDVPGPSLSLGAVPLSVSRGPTQALLHISNIPDSGILRLIVFALYDFEVVEGARATKTLILYRRVILDSDDFSHHHSFHPDTQVPFGGPMTTNKETTEGNSTNNWNGGDNNLRYQQSSAVDTRPGISGKERCLISAGSAGLPDIGDNRTDILLSAHTYAIREARPVCWTSLMTDCHGQTFRFIPNKQELPKLDNLQLSTDPATRQAEDQRESSLVSLTGESRCQLSGGSHHSLTALAFRCYRHHSYTTALYLLLVPLVQIQLIHAVYCKHGAFDCSIIPLLPFSSFTLYIVSTEPLTALSFRCYRHLSYTTALYLLLVPLVQIQLIHAVYCKHGAFDCSIIPLLPSPQLHYCALFTISYSVRHLGDSNLHSYRYFWLFRAVSLVSGVVVPLPRTRPGLFCSRDCQLQMGRVNRWRTATTSHRSGSTTAHTSTSHFLILNLVSESLSTTPYHWGILDDTGWENS